MGHAPQAADRWLAQGGYRGGTGSSPDAYTPKIRVLAPASLEEALDAIERPEDCERDCFRHGGTLSCECEEGDDGTWHDGC